MKRVIVYIISRMPAMMATALVLLAVLWLTLANFEVDPDDVPDIPYIDKIVHFIMFGGLAWIAVLDVCSHARRIGEPSRIIRPVYVALFAMVMSSLIGGVIEIAQDAMAMGRTADVWDWVADTAGSAAGAWIAWRMMQPDHD